MSSKRLSARRALDYLQSLPSDCSDSEESDSEETINPAIATSQTNYSSSSESSDDDNDDDESAVPQDILSEISRHSGTQADEEESEEGSSNLAKDGNQNPQSSDGGPGASTVAARFRSRDGSVWLKASVPQVLRGRLQQQNVLRIRPGPTSYSTARVMRDTPVSAFRVLFDEAMLRNIQKCTNAEAQRCTNDKNWSVTLDELDKFLGLIIARGIIGGRNMPLKSMWDKTWGCPLFSKTMARDRFLEIMKFLRFDMKNERRRNLLNDKFALASQLWNPFVENCQKAFVPHHNVTIDEQLLPCKARCKFIQYMANKPDKFGLKFWLAVDVEHKYMFNGFPYLGKVETRPGNVSVPTDVVLKLIHPFSKKGYNVTCDNFFTSLDLARQLAQKQCSIVGTIRQHRREIPEESKKKKQLHATDVFKYDGNLNLTLTSYQCKTSKSVVVLSSLHPDVQIPEEQNPKQKPETILFYNSTKVGVDVFDQMARMYSVKAASRRWPVHVFYNIIDMGLINSWIIYKSVCKSSISRKEYIQKIVEDLTGNIPHEPLKRSSTDTATTAYNSAPAKQRRKFATVACKNRTMELCSNCQTPVCGKCANKQCLSCAQA